MKQQRKSHLKEPTGRSKNQRPAQAAKEEPEMRQFRMDLKDEIKRTTEATRTTVAAQGGQRDDDDENAGKGHRGSSGRARSHGASKRDGREFSSTSSKRVARARRCRTDWISKMDSSGQSATRRTTIAQQEREGRRNDDSNGKGRLEEVEDDSSRTQKKQYRGSEDSASENGKTRRTDGNKNEIERSSRHGKRYSSE